MKVVVTGAGKGIGKRLAEVLNKHHEVTAIVRSLDTVSIEKSPINYISYADKCKVNLSINESDCVIHCAFDTKVPRKEFLKRNLDLNKHILTQSLHGTCELFVYFSSQVVYSGVKQVDGMGYHEEQECILSDKLDDYTKLKILSEQMIIESCQNSTMKFLILRPTIVLGEGLIWTDGMAKLFRRVPIGIKNRLMNLIHIDDVSLMVEKLINTKVENEIFNIGGKDYTSESYYELLSKLCSKRVRYIPSSIINRISNIIPSTLWFFKENVSINCNKIKLATGIQPKQPMDDIFIFNSFNECQCDSLDRLQALQRSSIPFRTYGIGYSLQLSPSTPVDKKLLLEGFSGIVSIAGDCVTVKSGTKLSDLSMSLEDYGLALPTLPEFSGVTAGACFFVEVHGSSCEFFSLYDLITEIKYLDENGNIVISQKNDAEWSLLRNHNYRFILVELTFKCAKFSYLCNEVEWKSDEVLLPYLAYDHRLNLSTTIQWYPYFNKCLIYNINQPESFSSKYVQAKPFYRGSPYRLQKLIFHLRMRGKSFQYDKCYNILGPWKEVPFRKLTKKYLLKDKAELYSVEFHSSIENILRFVSILKKSGGGDKIVFEPKHTIGFRFSYKKKSEKEYIGYIWVEILSDNLNFLQQFLDIAKEACSGNMHFHQGKYIPQ